MYSLRFILTRFACASICFNRGTGMVTSTFIFSSFTSSSFGYPIRYPFRYPHLIGAELFWAHLLWLLSRLSKFQFYRNEGQPKLPPLFLFFLSCVRRPVRC